MRANWRTRHQSNDYVRGYIFGAENLVPIKRVQRQIESSIKREKDCGTLAWCRFLSTRLEEYTFHPDQKEPNAHRFDFKKYLLKKIDTSHDVVRVLDIGASTGKQWIELMNMPKLEFYGVALSKAVIDERIASKVTVCSAGNIDKIFPSNYFDVIVSHYGIYYEKADALEKIVYALKPNGEAIVSGEDFFHGFYWLDRMYGLDGKHVKLFEVIASETGAQDDVGSWFYHIRKKIDAPVQAMMREMNTNRIGWMTKIENIIFNRHEKEGPFDQILKGSL